jgi:peptide deformylase
MLELHFIGDSALHSIAKEVKIGTDVCYTVSEMFKIMKQHKGVGLAANQVGLLERIIVVQHGGFKQAIINPVIVKAFGSKMSLRGGEGCLSVPNFRKRAIRDGKIHVEGFNADWNPVHFKLSGDTAIIVQHEIDHLNGITIGD